MTAAPQRGAGAPAGEDRAILCVDDDPVVQVLLGDMVRAAGARYRQARSSREAEALLAERSFDLVILDRRLPDSDGLLLIRTIRQRDNCPIIVLSGLGETQDRLLGLGLGATHYMTKPFSPPELSSRIRVALEERDRARQAAFEHDRLSFLPDTRRLTIDGTTTFLPPAEARLLQVLLARASDVVGRDQLTRKACGRDWSPGDRTVDVLIARLRKRLPKGIAEIVTVHRSGYALMLR